MTTRATTTAGEIAQFLGATLVGDRAVVLERLEVFDRAGAGCLTFIRTAKFARAWGQARGACALVSADIAGLASPEGAEPPAGRALIVVPDADLALVRVLGLFAPPAPPRAPGVHATAVVEAGARVAPTACVGAQCYIGPGAEVGDGAHLLGQVFVGAGARVGAHTTLHPGVRLLERCEVGSHCTLHAGVVIGADGFGYRPDPSGRGLVKVPHIGNVVVQDHVEIGANACVDRAKFASTVVGAGTKIDNLVQVAHNCVIGRCCILCGGTLLAGSVTLGDGVVLGGGVGVADNVSIGAGARIGAKSGVNHDVPPGVEYMGHPAGPATEWRRTFARLRMMGRRGGDDR
ncbi:MAG: UDP-3-O-(3-hydroxymyristoyl)glucosamine N-acyltransferase [Phycisphaerales bacterium]